MSSAFRHTSVYHELRLPAHVGVPLGEVHLHVGDLLHLLLVGVLSHLISVLYTKYSRFLFFLPPLRGGRAEEGVENSYPLFYKFKGEKSRKTGRSGR